MSDYPAAPAAAEVEASQSTLGVIRLPYGEEEPEGEDYVQIEPHGAGGFQFSGVVGFHAADVQPGSRTSTSGAIGIDGPFPTAEAAEAAAIEWAAEQGAETLYVLSNAPPTVKAPTVLSGAPLRPTPPPPPPSKVGTIASAAFGRSSI